MVTSFKIMVKHVLRIPKDIPQEEIGILFFQLNMKNYQNRYGFDNKFRSLNIDDEHLDRYIIIVRVHPKYSNRRKKTRPMQFITRKILFITLTFLILFTNNCQVPYEFENPEALSNIPVVQGILTNTDGPHSIRLHYARPYNTNQNENIEGANVWIGEVNGDSVRMEDMGKGDYTIAKGVFYPKTGREYKLTIHLPDGSVIHSLPSLMPDTIAIDKIYFKENRKTSSRIPG
jgi:hypothetical protein